MCILIAEKDLNGRRLLNRILTLEGFQVYVAMSGSHAMSLLQQVEPSIVVMNVFQCMHNSGSAPAGKINVRHYGEPKPVLLVTCSNSGNKLEEFMSEPDQFGNFAFDLLPHKIKGSMIDRIQQMCSALRQCTNWPSTDGKFNWKNFDALMDHDLVFEM